MPSVNATHSRPGEHSLLSVHAPRRSGMDTVPPVPPPAIAPVPPAPEPPLPPPPVPPLLPLPPVPEPSPTETPPQPASPISAKNAPPQLSSRLRFMRVIQQGACRRAILQKASNCSVGQAPGWHRVWRRSHGPRSFSAWLRAVAGRQAVPTRVKPSGERLVKNVLIRQSPAIAPTTSFRTDARDVVCAAVLRAQRLAALGGRRHNRPALKRDRDYSKAVFHWDSSGV